MVNNCFYTKFRAKIVKIFEIYKKNRLLSDFLFYSILFHHQTPAVRVLHSTVLNILQSMVEFRQNGSWFISKRVGDIIIRVEDLRQG